MKYNMGGFDNLLNLFVFSFFSIYKCLTLAFHWALFLFCLVHKYVKRLFSLFLFADTHFVFFFHFGSVYARFVSILYRIINYYTQFETYQYVVIIAKLSNLTSVNIQSNISLFLFYYLVFLLLFALSFLFCFSLFSLLFIQILVVWVYTGLHSNQLLHLWFSLTVKERIVVIEMATSEISSVYFFYSRLPHADGHTVAISENALCSYSQRTKQINRTTLIELNICSISNVSEKKARTLQWHNHCSY